MQPCELLYLLLLHTCGVPPHSERQPAAPWPVAVGDLAAPSIRAMGLLAVFFAVFSAVTDLVPIQAATLLTLCPHAATSTTATCWDCVLPVRLC